MKLKKFLSIILAALLMLAVTACSKEDEEQPVLKHEQPIATMVRAIKMSDTESYLNCFTQGARESYMNSEAYNSRLIEVLQPRQGKLSTVSIKETVVDAVKVKDGSLKSLENEYKDKYKLRIDISKAYDLTVEFSTVVGEQTVYDIRELTVIYTKSGWLVFGDVIDSFDFKEKTEENK